MSAWRRFFQRAIGGVSGDLGDRKNPVCCHDPSGEREYLSRLRGPSGIRPAFERTGSVGAGPYGGILDLYRVKAPGTPVREIYMDMNHPGYIERSPVPGFHICNIGSGRLAKMLALDAASLRSILEFAHSRDSCERILSFCISLMTLSYGEDRERVVSGLCRNAELSLNEYEANLVFTYVTGEGATETAAA